MLERTMSDAALEEPGPEPPFVLEAHSYSGGLRVQVLGRDPNRPAWVPPHDYVGFRNETALAPGDYIVEFARFAYHRRRVTWTGLYKPAVDEVFGDRLNHAGVGIWLLERDVLHAETLLHGLKRLADAVVEAGNEIVSGNADAFLGDDYLPAYVMPSGSLPPRLAGWSFVPGPLPETSLFAALDAEPERAWALAAEQLLRATILPGPSPAHGRMLILVRSAAGGEDPVGLDRIKPNLAGEIVRSLPAAVGETASDARAAREEAETVSARCRGLESELASEQARSSLLADRVSVLEVETDSLKTQLAGSEPYQAWSALKDQVREVSRQVSHTEQSVETARRDILDRLSAIQSRRAPASSPERSDVRRVDHREFLPGKQDDRSALDWPVVMWALIALAAALLLAMAAYVGWTQWTGG
jgi:hypothetical protein